MLPPTLATSCAALPPEGAAPPWDGPAAGLTPTLAQADANPIDERALSKLRWRCRRGLLENDLLLERFFLRMGSSISERQARAMHTLMDLSDPDLLDLLLSRKPPGPEQSSAEVLELLQQLRPVVQQPTPADLPKF